VYSKTQAGEGKFAYTAAVAGEHRACFIGASLLPCSTPPCPVSVLNERLWPCLCVCAKVRATKL
jgi:hypothetical protein